ncbi:MAG: YHYH protein [Actinomycetota bacterium]
MKKTWWVGAFALVLAAAACNGGDGGGDSSSQDDDEPAAAPKPETQPADQDVDLTRLDVGDDNWSAAETGVGMLCTTQGSGGAGAPTMGPWFNGDGTWNAETKYDVDGSVDWPSEFSVTIEGDTRVITGNGYPDHPTGVFPIDPSDDIYQIDPLAGMDGLTAVAFTLELPAKPTENAQPTCAGGEAGVGLNGVLLNVGIDAAGRDAAAWEALDSCGGHPNAGGYHQHSISDCIGDAQSGEGGHSDLVGYALDGFGIFGHYGEDGEVLTNADLDECHGHTHKIEWDGETVEMYHYHATYEFPYTIGCFQGTPINAGGGGAMGPPPAP